MCLQGGNQVAQRHLRLEGWGALTNERGECASSVGLARLQAMTSIPNIELHKLAHLPSVNISPFKLSTSKSKIS